MDEHTSVNTDEAIAKGPEAGKSKGARKAKVKAPTEGRGKRSLNLSLPVEDYERFMLHAMRMTNGNISELVCKLGREHLREFHITRTPARDSG